MPFSNYRPELMGSVTLEPTGSFEAGSYQSFTLVFTAGKFGLDDTGSLKIGFRFATDFGPVQFDDPSAPGYTTVEASNGAVLDCRWEFKRNIRPWSRSLYIGVIKNFLAPGDTITIRFGDSRQGSPGIRLQTFCETEFEFHVLTDAIATYDYVPLPVSPKISIVPGPGATYQALLPTRVRAGDKFRFCFKSIDKWGNPSDRSSGRYLVRPSRPVSGLPDSISLVPGTFGSVTDGLIVSEPGDIDITVFDDNGTELARSNPLRIVDANEPKVHFWGDTHGQSNETLGTNTAQEYFEFGRDKAFVDVMSHQGNDFQITGAFWQELNRLSAKFDKPGQFVCFPGYEWSANTAVGGDRNVHYRHEGETIYRSSHAQIADALDIVDEANDAHDANDLFEKLQGADCIVLAHVGGRYADIKFAHDGRLETSVEVHSAWGTFEWIIWDAFEKGYRIGIVGNSDGHKGRPGACYPGASFFGAQGGLTCYLADRLDRDGIFDSLRRRHHYATTGNRLVLEVAADFEADAELFHRDPALGSTTSELTRRAIMGDIVRLKDGRAKLHVDVIGSAPIERLDIFVGNQIIDTVRTFEQPDLGTRIRMVCEGAEYRGRARTTTWDGTLRIDDNAIEGAKMFNNWNLDRGIQRQTARELSWKAVTTGNFSGLDLWLADTDRGSIAIETRHAKTELSIREIGLHETTIDAGGLERRLRLFRLPDLLEERRISHSLTIPLVRQGDTPVLVRVTQEDGHRAWSSPIYIIRD